MPFPVSDAAAELLSGPPLSRDRSLLCAFFSLALKSGNCSVDRRSDLISNDWCWQSACTKHLSRLGRNPVCCRKTRCGLQCEERFSPRGTRNSWVPSYRPTHKKRHRASGPCQLVAGAGEGQSCRVDCCAASRMDEIGSESERGSNHATGLPGSRGQRCRDVLCWHRWVHLFQASSISLSPCGSS